MVNWLKIIWRFYLKFIRKEKTNLKGGIVKRIGTLKNLISFVIKIKYRNRKKKIIL